MLVGELGEERLLEQISRIFAATGDAVPIGIGDDAAVLRTSGAMQQVWTTDMLLEGIHFRRDWQGPSALGRKSLAVNLSDLAAMGARPTTALVSLAFPRAESVDEIIAICRGICEIAVEHGVAVVGGDLSASESGLMISVAAGGEVEEGAAVLRSGAAAGDTIYVTGFLGGAAAGLRLLEAGKSKDADGESLIEKFIDPRPRCRAGVGLAAAGIGAMTDLSDGLSTDLRHICIASGVGANVHSDSIPREKELVVVADKQGWQLEELLFSGGEDYELLFTADEVACGEAIFDLASSLDLQVSSIGVITDEAGDISLLDNEGAARRLQMSGFDHFGKRP